MSKLGYTWYPKDWNNSDKVFELSLSQRGLYRELIDMAMLNDNKTIINLKTWSRKWDVTEEVLSSMIGELCKLDLVILKDNDLFIPSCEPRLNLIRGGKKGGSKSKKNKPKGKPSTKPIDKPTPNQIESKDKIKEKVKEWAKESHLKVNLVLDTFDRAWDYYEGLGWKNKNGKDVIRGWSTIRNNWFQNLDEFRLGKPKQAFVIDAATGGVSAMRFLIDQGYTEEYIMHCYKEYKG